MDTSANTWDNEPMKSNNNLKQMSKKNQKSN